ncbi:MAG TPA: hypothetical protein VIU02_05410, partial [Burkholderiales bacterium]
IFAFSHFSEPVTLHRRGAEAQRARKERPKKNWRTGVSKVDMLNILSIVSRNNIQSLPLRDFLHASAPLR